MSYYPYVVPISRSPPNAIPTPPSAWPAQHLPPLAYTTTPYHSRELPTLPPTMTTYIHPTAIPSMAPAYLPRSMIHPAAVPSMSPANLPHSMTHPVAAFSMVSNLPPTMTTPGYPAATPSVAHRLPSTLTTLGHPGATPMAPANPPRGPPTPPLGAPPADTARANIGRASSLDHMDPFAEGLHYVPVLEPSLVGVGTIIRINPLLAPPEDLLEPQLRWNMLFHASNCYRPTTSRRSWIKRRKAPATYPRLTYVRIISHSFPWIIQIDAQDLTTGVTCGEILDGISEYLYSDVTKEESENLPEILKPHIFSSYEHNRSTDPNVPGGGLGVALKRLDWLGHNTMFGGLVVNDKFIKEHCGDILPATFELKCQPNRSPTAQDLHEQPSPQKAMRSTNGSQLTPSGSVTANELHEQPLHHVYGSANESQFTPSYSSAYELQEQPWRHRATSTIGSQSTRSSLVTANELHEEGPLRQQVMPSPNGSLQPPSRSSSTTQPYKRLRQKATGPMRISQSTGQPFSLELYITFDGAPSVRTYQDP